NCSIFTRIRHAGMMTRDRQSLSPVFQVEPGARCGMAVDGSGNVYLADRTEQTITSHPAGIGPHGWSIRVKDQPEFLLYVDAERTMITAMKIPMRPAHDPKESNHGIHGAHGMKRNVHTISLFSVCSVYSVVRSLQNGGCKDRMVPLVDHPNRGGSSSESSCD